MSIMDSHSHPSLARGNAAGSNLLAHETNTKPVVVNASAASTNVENASQSPSASHSHQHHQHHHHPNHPHHQFVESSPVYHHPFRTITPNSAETNNKILDSHPQSKSSTPTNQQHTQSRPNSSSTSEWPVNGIALPSASHPLGRRPFSSSANLEGSAAREPPPTSSGAGTGYPSPTATSTSRRSSSNANPHPSPNQTELITSALTTTASAAAPAYYQTHSGQDPTSLAVIAAIDCGGLDVRPMYGSEDSRQTSGQNPSQSRNESHTPSHTRVPSSEEMRGPYYTSATAPHYSPTGSGILPSHYPHLASPIAPQSGPRRPTSSANSGPAYSPYSNLSVQIPLGSNSYGHHSHTHHPDGSVLPWAPSVDSVRDSVSPYSRPGRQPSGSHAGHHAPSSTPFAHSLRNGQLMSSPHYPSNNNAAHHHQASTMQYNAQGRPLAYMCNTCLRAFDRPSALQIHERSHTGERPFPCPWNGCVKRFTTHGNMVKHSRVCPFREPED
ncbi:hypothetical protein PSTG_00527 [Puccinia striiformis f. sp. tritici PST-78]|uniref:C2H2-type domain-containing protein n=1 Tax=Puccinia striiformis f. sp. tritici PST-78 TaxID=1165861 RepID=A0A0L0W549_9BASI|nr:hypothetical protein PSTG_00527 [Puccinia striiformis f. sp. tritici PST-78]